MNDAQPDADPQRDSADNRAPHEVALMHLAEQREHQQPRRSDGNQHTRIASAQMSRHSARTQNQCAKVKQTQRPLQRQIQIERSDMSRQKGIF